MGPVYGELHHGPLWSLSSSDAKAEGLTSVTHLLPGASKRSAVAEEGERRAEEEQQQNPHPEQRPLPLPVLTLLQQSVRRLLWTDVHLLLCAAHGYGL